MFADSGTSPHRPWAEQFGAARIVRNAPLADLELLAYFVLIECKVLRAWRLELADVIDGDARDQFGVPSATPIGV